jgi:ribose 5-phosphate isomerase RpiB
MEQIHLILWLSWFCSSCSYRCEEEGKADFGIVICGSGNGIAMTVNKHAKVEQVYVGLKK